MRGHCPRRKRKRPELSRCLSSACRLPTTCLPVTYYHLSLCRLPTGCLPVTCLPPVCHLPTTCLSPIYHLPVPYTYHLSSIYLSIICHQLSITRHLSIIYQSSICLSIICLPSLSPSSLSVSPACPHPPCEDTAEGSCPPARKHALTCAGAHTP